MSVKWILLTLSKIILLLKLQAATVLASLPPLAWTELYTFGTTIKKAIQQSAEQHKGECEASTTQ